MKKIMILLIKGYQKTVSPMLGDCCRFYPSCSTYGIQAYQEWGFWKGSWLTLKRVLKCGPWHRGGIDEVPKNAKGGT